MGEGTRIKRPTSRDVARLAGVSHTTVSFVVNAVPSAGISEVTRTRVLRAVAQLDYHPHEGARSLGRRATRSIGVAIPDTSNPHYLEITAGIADYAAQEGYSVLLATTNFALHRERQCLMWLKQRRSDALIALFVHGPDLLEEMRVLRRSGYPVTLLGVVDDEIDSSTPHSREGERLLLDHLSSLGHRAIGYIYGVFNQQVYGERLQTCLDLQEELGLAVVGPWVRRCGPAQDDGYAETHALLRECAGGPRPTALVVVNDHLAVGVLAALHEAGVAVPAAISVASFDNTRLSRYTVPPLTTVDYDARAMGQQAARLTIERLAALDTPSVSIGHGARLVVRGSTAAVARA